MEKKSNAWGITAMVCGILSLCLILAPYVGLPLAIMGIVGFYQQKKVESNGMGVTGLILGIIGIVINSIMLLLTILFVGLFSAAL